MTEVPFPIVGFDLDGTLVDSLADLTAAANHALAQGGRRALTTHEMRAMIGAGTRTMFQRALAATGGSDEATIERLLPALLDYYEAHLADQTRPYPGAIAALDELRGLGVRLAVVTNKLERFARQVLGAGGILDRFETVIGGDTTGAAKPSPVPVQAMVERLGGGRAAFIGDSIYDMRAALGAGLPSVAVSFGFSDGPVDELGADAVIDRYDELVPALRRLGERAVAR